MTHTPQTQNDTARFYGWVITEDHIEPHEDVARVGYGQTAETGPSSFMSVPVDQHLDGNRVKNPIQFRTLDEDGEVYYSGVISHEWANGDESLAFGPLHFASADAGATVLQIKDPVKDKDWVTI